MIRNYGHIEKLTLVITLLQLCDSERLANLNSTYYFTDGQFTPLPYTAAGLISTTINSGVPLCHLNNDLDAIYWGMAESQPAGSAINTLPINGISAAGADRNIELNLTRGLEWFQLDADTKQLLLTRSVDRDLGPNTLSGAVRCRVLVDTDNLVVKELEHAILIIVQDANDNPPMFSAQDYYVNITEEMPLGSIILSELVATDADQDGPNNQVQYSVVLKGLGYKYAEIADPWKGELRIRQRINFEDVNNFTVEIVARDDGNPPLQSSAVVHVTVVDVDDLNPVFEYQTYFAVLEPQAQSGPLKIQPARITAFDGDTLRAPIGYTLSGERSDDFSIDMFTGDVTYKGTGIPPTNYALLIHAKQLDRPEREAQASLRVTASGGPNDNRPYFTRKLYTAEISEAAPVGVKILQVTAMDYDKASTLFYSIKDSYKYPEFSLSRDGGELALAKQLDYEKVEQYHLSIMATDGKQTAEASVQIFVLNANDHAPVFERITYTFQPTSFQGDIGRVQASDSDGHSEVRYRLANLNDVFTIDPVGGTITASTRATNGSRYELVVIAEDNGDPPRSTHVTVVVDTNAVADEGRAAPPSPADTKTAGGLFGRGGGLFSGEMDGMVRGLVFGLGLLALLLVLACIVLLLCICRMRKKRAAPESAFKSHIADKIIYANQSASNCSGNTRCAVAGYDDTVTFGRYGAGVAKHPSFSDRYNGYYGIIDKRRPLANANRIESNSMESSDSPHGSTSPLHRSSPPPVTAVRSMADAKRQLEHPFYSSVNDRRLSHTYVPVVESVSHSDFLLARAHPPPRVQPGTQSPLHRSSTPPVTAVRSMADAKRQLEHPFYSSVNDRRLSHTYVPVVESVSHSDFLLARAHPPPRVQPGTQSPLHRSSPPPVTAVRSMADAKRQLEHPFYSSVNDRRLSHTYVPVVESVSHSDFLLARAHPPPRVQPGTQSPLHRSSPPPVTAVRSMADAKRQLEHPFYSSVNDRRLSHTYVPVVESVSHSDFLLARAHPPPRVQPGTLSPLHRSSPPPVTAVRSMADAKRQLEHPFYSSVNDRRLSHTYVPVVESVSHSDFLLARAHPPPRVQPGRQELREISVETSGVCSAPVSSQGRTTNTNSNWAQPMTTVYF